MKKRIALYIHPDIITELKTLHTDKDQWINTQIKQYQKTLKHPPIKQYQKTLYQPSLEQKTLDNLQQIPGNGYGQKITNLYYNKEKRKQKKENRKKLLKHYFKGGEKNMINEMKYTPIKLAIQKEPETLTQNTYKNHEYLIITRHTHPCAYIILTDKDKLFTETENNITNNIKCHGGITYIENHLGTKENRTISPSPNKRIIGWDYAHYNDQYGTENDGYKGKKWTTKEILDEIKNVIEQIIKINKEK